MRFCNSPHSRIPSRYICNVLTAAFPLTSISLQRSFPQLCSPPPPCREDLMVINAIMTLSAGIPTFPLMELFTWGCANRLLTLHSFCTGVKHIVQRKGCTKLTFCSWGNCMFILSAFWTSVNSFLLRFFVFVFFMMRKMNWNLAKGKAIRPHHFRSLGLISSFRAFPQLQGTSLHRGLWGIMHWIPVAIIDIDSWALGQRPKVWSCLSS